MESKILIVILAVSLIINIIFIVNSIPSKTQENITPLEICESDFDCSSELKCEKGTLCDEDTSNCVTANYCQSKTIDKEHEEEIDKQTILNKSGCSSSRDCGKCGNFCRSMSLIMRADCMETTEEFDCKCENNKCVKTNS